MKKHNHEWYASFVSDSTYKQMAGQDPDIPGKIKEKIKWFRDQWRSGEEAFEIIIEASRHISSSSDLEDPELIAWAASYEAMALSACNRWDESVWPIFRGLRYAKNAGLRAKLYNLLAIRLFKIDKDYHAAEYYARKGWDISKSALNAWANITTLCEIKLSAAREGVANMRDTIVEIDSLMGELCNSVSGAYENLPQDCINYLHRSLGLLEYREYNNGKLFRNRFGQTGPQ